MWPGRVYRYLDNQTAIDAYRIRQQQRFDELRRTAEPLPDHLRRRLDAAREQLRGSGSWAVS